MPPEERKRRMHRMRKRLNGSTIFDWLDSILARSTEIMHDQKEAHEAIVRATPDPVERDEKSHAAAY